MAISRRDSKSSISSLVREKLQELPFYYSHFQNTKEVAKFIKNWAKKRKPYGCYLVRPSFSNASCLTVSVLVQDDSVRHAKVVIEGTDPQSFYLVPEIRFESLQKLLEYYSENTVYNVEGVEDVKFTYPIQDNGTLNNNSLHSNHGSFSGSLHGFTSTSPEGYTKRNPLFGLNQSQSNLFFQESPGEQHGNVEPIPIYTAKEENKSVRKVRTPESKIKNTVPQLPPRPELPVRSASSLDQSAVDTNNLHYTDDPITNRPPAPLPNELCGSRYEAADPYYSSPSNTDEDMTQQLKKALKLSDICECGIPRELSELPGGWAIHRSKDDTSFNKGFFQSVSGQTLWRLPPNIQNKLNPLQKANLRKIDHMFGPNFIQYDIWEEPRNEMLRRGTSQGSLIESRLDAESPRLGVAMSQFELHKTHF